MGSLCAQEESDIHDYAPRALRHGFLPTPNRFLLLPVIAVGLLLFFFLPQSAPFQTAAAAVVTTTCAPEVSFSSGDTVLLQNCRGASQLTFQRGSSPSAVVCENITIRLINIAVLNGIDWSRCEIRMRNVFIEVVSSHVLGGGVLVSMFALREMEDLTLVVRDSTVNLTAASKTASLVPRLIYIHFLDQPTVNSVTKNILLMLTSCVITSTQLANVRESSVIYFVGATAAAKNLRVEMHSIVVEVEDERSNRAQAFRTLYWYFFSASNTTIVLQSSSVQVRLPLSLDLGFVSVLHVKGSLTESSSVLVQDSSVRFQNSWRRDQFFARLGYFEDVIRSTVTVQNVTLEGSVTFAVSGSVSNMQLNVALISFANLSFSNVQLEYGSCTMHLSTSSNAASPATGTGVTFVFAVGASWAQESVVTVLRSRIRGIVGTTSPSFVDAVGVSIVPLDVSYRTSYLVQHCTLGL